MNLEKQKYKVNNVIEEAKDIVTIQFVPSYDGAPKLEFTAGQFVRMALLENSKNPQNLSDKPYSISSSPKKSHISISVKKVGPFSSALHDLKEGNEVEIYGPFGGMKTEEKMKKIVFIAGGIGSAPFFSMIKDLYEQEKTEEKTKEEVTFFYSNKTQEDVAFYKELREIEKKWKKFKMVNILTQVDLRGIPRRSTQLIPQEQRRLDVEMLKKYVPNINEQNYFLCGTISFVTQISEMLEAQKINEKQIFVELFY